MIELIKDKKQWAEELALAQHLDFYHTYDYHNLSRIEGEFPILVKYNDGSTSLLLPLLLRNIENSDYKDATSVYGYAGVLTQVIDGSFNKENFHKELNAFFVKNKIVSVFSRLHPFIDNQERFHLGLGTITNLGKVVNIDLTDSVENQRAKFNRRLKTYLNKSRKSCTVIEGNIEEHLGAFINLYVENMKRVNADKNYFFNTDYFHRLLTSNNYKSELMLCRHNETQEIIAGAIFIKTGNIVQYHLSGLNEDYYCLNPIKLIIDEVRIKSTEEEFKYFNLGGGRGSNDDSLFKFKSGFSKDFRTFKIWKYIVDEDVYRLLVDKNNGPQSNTDFFPAYRVEQ